MLEKTPKCLLDSKESQTVYPQGNQSWIFIGRADAEAETPVLWPPDVKNRLIEKTLMLGEIEGGRRRDDRGWDGWMASPTPWTWVWPNPGSWWWTGKLGVLQSMGWRRVGYALATEEQQNARSASVTVTRILLLLLLQAIVNVIDTWLSVHKGLPQGDKFSHPPVKDSKKAGLTCPPAWGLPSWGMLARTEKSYYFVSSPPPPLRSIREPGHQPTTRWLFWVPPEWVFQGDSVVKNPTASAGDSGDAGSIPGSGRPPVEENANPRPYSCLENPTDRGAWWATVHGVAESWTRLSDYTSFFIVLS